MQQQSVAEICINLAKWPEALEAVASGGSYLPLLVLLEKPMPEVESQLHLGLVAAGISNEVRATVSLEKLVLFALRSWGSHWPSLALSWLEGGMAIGSEIASALEIISQSKQLPQPLRHRAFALVKQWHRAQPSQAQNDA